MIRRIPVIAAAIAVAALAGCASHAPAPVEERGGVAAGKGAPAPVAAAAAESREGFYVVKRGDTLYRIALDHGVDYKELAAWNSLENPNRIEVGQQLRVAAPEGAAVAKPVAAGAPVETRPLGGGEPAPANTDTLKREPKGGKQPWSEAAWAQAQKGEAAPPPKPPEKAPEAARPAEKPAEKAPAPVPAAAGEEAGDWVWPAAGKVTASFVEGGNKGIDIAARSGDPVLAAAAGKVTYSGSAIRGYGNLLIIRHGDLYSSVYAHNSRILVKEGQSVARGQKIAEAGSTDTDSPRLHFEIRRQGKPVDPLKFLPPR
ncbi:MAG: peptidoglycan DD-metalloendopeptidase family protein [Rhodocyclaceae bacterium]|nr:peptidoglycan DD-metalloendopeptidase family protein [Rhodocyclaceae bacterium]